MRILHRVIAFLLRRFWTQCPRCLQMFGGHEKHTHQLKDPNQHGKQVHYRIVCGHCSKLLSYKK